MILFADFFIRCSPTPFGSLSPLSYVSPYGDKGEGQGVRLHLFAPFPIRCSPAFLPRLRAFPVVPTA